MQTDEIIYKQYVHIGVAVDTDRGLLVPVIRDVDQKDIFQIADEIAQAAEKARSRKLSLDDMQGGSITISNLGSLGGGAVHADRQLARGGDPGRGARAHGAGVTVDGEFVAAVPDAADALLRSPRHRRRRRRAHPALDRRSHRTACADLDRRS